MAESGGNVPRIIARFAGRCSSSKNAITVIAESFGMEHLLSRYRFNSEIRAVFKRIDVDGNSRLTLNEFRRAFLDSSSIHFLKDTDGYEIEDVFSIVRAPLLAILKLWLEVVPECFLYDIDTMADASNYQVIVDK